MSVATTGPAAMPGPFSWPPIMGILNVTPDSFSDGGQFIETSQAIAAGLRMVADGAGLIDVGGESTRPGAAEVLPAEEQARILPVIRGLAGVVMVSVDTRHASTMAAALDAGATVVNDVSALMHDPDAAALVAARGCPVILMHMRGTPATMASFAHYDDLVEDVLRELAARVDRAVAAGVDQRRIAIDPGIGFAKTADQNVLLLRHLNRLTAPGLPIVAGVSRKRFLTALSGAERSVSASVAAALAAWEQGARTLRVHDVAETAQALKVWQALRV